jgi:hypothetical protein
VPSRVALRVGEDVELAEVRAIDGNARLLAHFAYRCVFHRLIDLHIAAHDRQPRAVVPMHHEERLERSVARGTISPLDDDVHRDRGRAHAKVSERCVATVATASVQLPSAGLGRQLMGVVEIRRRSAHALGFAANS